MKPYECDNTTRRQRGQRVGWVLLFLPAIPLFLQGCAVDDICVVSYTSSAEVKPEQSGTREVVGSSPFPWDIVLRGVSDIFTGARKKAIENKVGYRESRSFTLFRLKKADSQSERCEERTDAPPGQASDGVAQ